MRLVACALATGYNSEYADHLHDAVIQLLLPDGPIAQFLNLRNELINDPATRPGVTHLRDWAMPWIPTT